MIEELGEKILDVTKASRANMTLLIAAFICLSLLKISKELPNISQSFSVPDIFEIFFAIVSAVIFIMFITWNFFGFPKRLNN